MYVHEYFKTFFFFKLDCGTSFSMSNGFAMYAGRETTVNNTVPLACMPGYSLHGDEHMTCLQNESWHHISHCEPVGRYTLFKSIEHYIKSKDISFIYTS